LRLIVFQKQLGFAQLQIFQALTLGEATYPTPMADMFVTGDKLTFDTLNVTFLVDEELQNYREIWEWIVGMGAPRQHEQFSDALTKGDGTTLKFSTVGSDDSLSPRDAAVMKGGTPTEGNIYSDANLIIYSSKNTPKVEVKFKDMFPTSLSGLDYSQEATDVEYFKATATFRYLYYEFATST